MRTVTILTRDDLYTPQVDRLRKFYEARLVSLRTQNDMHQEADKTALLRGRIQEVKKLLAILTDSPAQVTDAAE
jgi:hypothetical protein